jgi:MFS transporter, MCT family, solute carrier family 16 (monocarboxylic acid transporters), member 10
VYTGWSVRILGFFSLFCFIVAYFTVFPRRPTKPLPPVWSLVDFEAFKDPCFTLLAIGNWLSIFSIFNPMFYVGLYGTAVSGGQSKLAPYFLSLLCAGAIPGRVSPGLIAPYVGR